MVTTNGTICQVLHTLDVGGAEVLATQHARRLAVSYRFVFACLDSLGTLGEELLGEGFPVEVLGRVAGVDLGCSHRLARFLRRERVDLVHAHQYTPFFYAATARFLYRRPPVLFTEHGRSFPDYPRPKRIAVNRLLLQRRDRVVGVGEAVRQALIANEGIPPGRVSVIYNGVDLPACSSIAPDRQKVRRELGVSDSDLVIIQVARLDPLKDHATAIRVIEQVSRRRPDAALVLVGDGPEGEMIRDLIGQKRLESHVRMLGLRKDVPRLLPAADVALLTSVSEGIPLFLIEAMAAGIPVVSTRVGGVGEIIRDGVTGLLAPAGDDAALADCILRLADDPATGEQIRRQGQERVAAQFCESRMLECYDRLYADMLNGCR